MLLSDGVDTPGHLRGAARQARLLRRQSPKSGPRRLDSACCVGTLHPEQSSESENSSKVEEHRYLNWFWHWKAMEPRARYSAFLSLVAQWAHRLTRHIVARVVIQEKSTSTEMTDFPRW